VWAITALVLAAAMIPALLFYHFRQDWTALQRYYLGRVCVLDQESGFNFFHAMYFAAAWVASPAIRSFPPQGKFASRAALRASCELIFPSAAIVSPGCIPAGQAPTYFSSMINVASAMPSIGGVKVVVFSVCAKVSPLTVSLPLECIVHPDWVHPDLERYFEPEPVSVLVLQVLAGIAFARARLSAS